MEVQKGHLSCLRSCTDFWVNPVGPTSRLSSSIPPSLSENLLNLHNGLFLERTFTWRTTLQPSRRNGAALFSFFNQDWGICQPWWAPVCTEPSLSVSVRYRHSFSSSRHVSTQQDSWFCFVFSFLAVLQKEAGDAYRISLLTSVNISDLFNKCVKAKIVFLMNSVSCVSHS